MCSLITQNIYQRFLKASVAFNILTEVTERKSWTSFLLGNKLDSYDENLLSTTKVLVLKPLYKVRYVLLKLPIGAKQL